jgi:hypothetical protein
VARRSLPSVDLSPTRTLSELPLYEKLGWVPHIGQQKVIAAGGVRNRVVAAGRRFGKSEVGGHKLIQEALNTRLVKQRLDELGKRREFWIVGPTMGDAEKEFRVCWNGLTKAGLGEYFDRPGSYYNPSVGDLHLSMWGGRFQVHGKSAMQPETLVGEGLCGAILAEAAKLKPVVWTRFVRPTLADFGGWSLMTSTPEGRDPLFYESWARGQDPQFPDWWSMRAPSWMNPYVYPQGASDEGIAALRAALEAGETAGRQLFARCGVDPEIGDLVVDLTEEGFNQEIAALFTEFVGRVFKGFDEEIHVGDFEYDRSWKTYAAVDYGFTNPSVWLLIQVDPHGELVRVVDEVYERGLTPNEFAAEIKARGLCPDGILGFYPDPASPGDTRILEEALRVKARGGTGGEIKWRVDAIRKALKVPKSHLPDGHPEKLPSLQINRRCTDTISDMLNYRYPSRKIHADGNTPENPEKKNDHAPEALGRFYAGHFGTPDRQARRARVASSSVASTSRMPSPAAGQRFRRVDDPS